MFEKSAVEFFRKTIVQYCNSFVNQRNEINKVAISVQYNTVGTGTNSSTYESVADYIAWNLTLYNIRIAPFWSFSFHLDNYIQ
jgi:hypothetical protein